MQQPQQNQQQQPTPGLFSSALSKLEQAARSAAPGLTQQVDRLMASVGVVPNSGGSSSAQQHYYYQQPGGAMPPYPAPAHGYHYQQQPVTQVYPPPQLYAPPPAPWQQQQQQQQPQAHYSQQPQQLLSHPHPQQQQHHNSYPHPHQQPHLHQQAHQHPQQQQQREIPILEASIHIKPSRLPVGSRHVAAPAAAHQPGQQQQQQVMPDVVLQQHLQQLWASAVPAAAQHGTAASSLVGRWYHQDAGALSEVVFMPDGRCHWSRTAVVWHGVWRLLQEGKLSLVYIEQPQQQHGSSTPLQQQHRVMSWQRGALDDTLVLDGLAHVKLGLS